MIIQPRTTQSVPWYVDLDSVKLTDLQSLIANEYPKFENPTLSFRFRLDNHITEEPSNDQHLQHLLRRLVIQDQMTVKVTVTTPAKPYSDWTMSSVRRLFGLGESDRFPPFSCGTISPTKPSLEQLRRELKLRTENTPIDEQSPEASRSLYTYSYLLAAVDNFKQKFIILPEQRVDGPYGVGLVDYMITSISTSEIVGVTEVKKDDVSQGIAQCVVQLQSVITRKRKVDEEEQESPRTAFGIVTDAEKFFFLKCVDNEGKTTLEMSKRVIIDYNAENWEDQVNPILGNIVWLLAEAQKSPSNSPRETKRLKI